MKCITLSVCFLLAGMAAFSQDWPVKKLVTTNRQKKIFFKPIKAFSFTQNKVLKDKGNYKELNLEAGFISKLVQEKPDAIQVAVPLNNNESI